MAMKRTRKQLQKDINQIIRAIERAYLLPEKQSESGPIKGNSWPDEKGLSDLTALRELSPERRKIYLDLKKELKLETFFAVLCKIQQGFLYVWEEGNPLRMKAGEFRKAKESLEKQVEDLRKNLRNTNKNLAAKNPFFKTFPIPLIGLDDVVMLPHPLDQVDPPKAIGPSELKNQLIKELSDLLKSSLPKVGDRAKFISRILRFFYLTPESESNARIIRQHM
jgi:hypothetical protein